ncbi:MAG: hypothetical protein OXG99_07675, partial [Alphaproteobacteria bacterium]|nr:hypothetical protein [Alphaproteobacteria bacterium]
DIEIIKAIPPRNGDREPGIEYCGGFEDHENCGVSVICAYDYATGRYRVFMEDNFAEFVALADDPASMPVIGFNSMSFDDKVLAANELAVTTNYDLLREMWRSVGLGPEFQYPTHVGFSLDATAKANGLPGKTGHGALAPVQWQLGEIGQVVDYCLEDVRLTKTLIDKVLRYGRLTDPRFPDRVLRLPRP